MSGLRPGPWIPRDYDPLAQAIARVALADIGICEDPLGSNRSPEIDEYLAKIGVELGQPWCAAIVAGWFRAGPAQTPPGAAASSTRAWFEWAHDHHLWTATPRVGYAVLFGRHGVPDHIGLCVRTAPALHTIEGNTSLDPTGSQREGIAVDLKDRTTLREPAPEHWRILGYVRPARAEIP